MPQETFHVFRERIGMPGGEPSMHPFTWNTETQTLSEPSGLIKPLEGPFGTRVNEVLNPNAPGTLQGSNCHGVSLFLAGEKVFYDQTQLVVESGQVLYRGKVIAEAEPSRLVGWQKPNVIHTTDNGVRSIPSEMILNHPETQAIVDNQLQKLEITTIVKMAQTQALWVLISGEEFPPSEAVSESPEGNFHSFVTLPPGTGEEAWVINKPDYGAGISIHPVAQYLAPAGEHGLHIYAKPTQEELTTHQF